MKNLFLTIVTVAVVFFAAEMTAVAQRVSNYTPTRATGITYNSISSIGNSVNSWRNSDPGQMLDDNRSFPIPIGFDCWYDGVRYTTLSVGINGLVDFSSSAATGYTSGDYDSDNFVGTNPQIRMTTLSGYTSRNALAIMYGDLTTQNIVDPLGNSFKYLTTGTAPNRVLTVEWINLSYYSQYKGESYNFQLKLYESTGVIEFLYGNNTAGTGIPLKYKTGLNAPSFTALSDSVVMIQQNANSTYFLPQPVPAWGGGYWGGYNDTLPTANSKLVFTPPTPADPTNLTFSAITQTSMTLNWIDNANNEIGYAIYNSLDGSNYTYITQLSRNSTSYPAAGLSPGTTYYWRVYAVTEGQLSANLDGSQATPGANLYTSQGTGNWNVITWSPAGPPANNSDIQIRDVDVVTINQNITVNNITVGTGTSGTLQIGNDATARTLNVLGNITVNAGAQFAVNAGSTTSGHILNLTGNVLNNGTFDLGPSATTRCQTIFNRAGTQTISGTGAMTRFYLMTLNMGTSNNNLLDITSSNFSTQSTEFLTITNGTFKYEAPSAVTPFAASYTIPLTGGLWVNNSSAVVSTGGNLSYTGFVRVTAGVLNVGTVADQQLVSNGGDIIIEGGAVNVAGSFNRTNNMTITRLTMTGGTLRVANVGSTSTTLTPFMMDIVGSSFNMSSGAIVVVREGGTGANDLGYVNTGSTSYSVTGGTLQIGDYSTPVAQTIQINSTIPVYNLTDSSANATIQLMTNNLTVNNNVLIAAGTLNANNLNMNVQENWTNQGTFIPGTGTVTFNGSTGSIITKVTGETFNNLTINKSSNDVSLGGAATVNGALNFASAHNLLLGANNLTLNGTVVGAADGKCVVTNGTGVVSKVIAAAGNFTFPVGISTRYNPVAFTSPIGGTYTAAVVAGENPATALDAAAVGRTWTITGTNPADVTFTWNSADAGGSCVPLSCDAWRFNGTAWIDMVGATAGSGPTYTTTLTNVVSFSKWTIGNGGALPVEMTSFTAVLQGTSALLNWATATETNNSGFQIERSVEGSGVWAEVAFVAGAGTSSSPKTYSYEDKNLAPGKYIYRIKQIDNDGKFKYYTANMPKVDAGVSNTLQLCGNYPNPFNPTTNIQFSVPQDGYASLKIYNILGQEVTTLFAGIAKAGHYIPATFNASRLASGIYFARLQYNDKSLVQRMLLTK